MRNGSKESEREYKPLRAKDRNTYHVLIMKDVDYPKKNEFQFIVKEHHGEHSRAAGCKEGTKEAEVKSGGENTLGNHTMYLLMIWL